MDTGFWLEKTGRKTPLGRTKCSWEDNIGMDIEGTGFIWLGTDNWRALVNTVMKLGVP
jgi:hypothetical protein